MPKLTRDAIIQQFVDFGFKQPDIAIVIDRDFASLIGQDNSSILMNVNDIIDKITEQVSKTAAPNAGGAAVKLRPTDANINVGEGGFALREREVELRRKKLELQEKVLELQIRELAFQKRQMALQAEITSVLPPITPSPAIQDQRAIKATISNQNKKTDEQKERPSGGGGGF